MTQVLDYAWYRPYLPAVRQKYVGVMRYLAPLPNGKVITPVEYQALQAAGLQVGLNWESYANRAREGAASGKADATTALHQASVLGATGAIYFSVDYDAPETDQAALNEYFKACAGVIGLRRLGAYGGYWVLKRLFDAGLIIYGWQTIAWSGTNRESRAHLFQTGKTDFNGQADINDVLKDDWTGDSVTTLENYKMQQAKDIWDASTGIHTAWLAAFERNIVLGPPVSSEIKTVDWNGNAIVRQDFAHGWVEYYVQAAPGHPAGSNGGYTMAGAQLVQLW